MRSPRLRKLVLAADRQTSAVFESDDLSLPQARHYLALGSELLEHAKNGPRPRQAPSPAGAGRPKASGTSLKPIAPPARASTRAVATVARASGLPQDAVRAWWRVSEARAGSHKRRQRDLFIVRPRWG